MLKKIARKVLGREGSGLEGYQFFIDVVSPELIAGWAANTKNTQHKPIVDVCSNGEVLWQVKAESFREDLTEAGIGDFAFKLKPVAAVLKRDITEVDIHIDGHKVNEQPYPLVMQCPNEGCLTSHFAMAHEHYTGHVDAITENLIVGWVMANANPNIRAKVVLVHNGEELAATVADQYRGDLHKGEAQDGCHSFRLNLPVHKFPSASFECDLQVDGQKVNPQPIRIELDQNTLEVEQYKHNFASELGDFNALISAELNRLHQAVESETKETQGANLNVAVNVALQGIAELSARVSVMERVLVKHFSENE
ncbi:hypothetical protein [Reinekea marinisedimentorum]|uniref:Uncharacterized protein n=1 Tax=Reinekea marinisedimentorum TaxID=230495 RepID=A0A4R3I724_9GAMM|nr:hypothetical protein [Reinekea marinisedimentorum]TCS41936.1 hypothetical protein BCF53_10440 [Reinekea marinisedimentorum]